MKQKKKTLEEISASITRYYDSLTEEEVAEDRAWAEFAATQLAGQECRDQPADAVGEGTSEIQRLVIARQLLKE
jgi:alkylation response protein AidB-like acyl-CoA dehydrogenase